MSKSKLIVGITTLAMALVVGVAAQTTGTASNTKPAAKPAAKEKKAADAKPAKAKAAPKSDADIQDCITKKLAAAPKLKDQGFTVSVANGVATFIGTANNGGSKGAVSGIAKSCGAKSVVNNITVKAKEKAAPAAKPAKAEPKKK